MCYNSLKVRCFHQVLLVFKTSTRTPLRPPYAEDEEEEGLLATGAPPAVPGWRRSCLRVSCVALVAAACILLTYIHPGKAVQAVQADPILKAPSFKL